MEILVNDIFTIIEAMASVYDLEKTTLKEFVRDVKQCHALHQFLCQNIKKD